MRGPEHATVAGATAAGAFWLMTHGDAGLSCMPVVGAAALGALMPDIDHPRSLIGNGLPARLLMLGVGALVAVTIGDKVIAREGTMDLSAVMIAPMLDAVRPYLNWAWLAVGIGVGVLLISVVTSLFLRHRGPTHSLLAAAIVTAVACLAFAVGGQPWLLGLWLGWGYLSHLLADAPSEMGCPALLWPWVRGDALR